MKLYDVIRKENPDLVKKEEFSEKETVVINNKTPKNNKRLIFFIFIIGAFLSLIYILGINFTKSKIYIKERNIPFNLEKGLSVEIPHEETFGTNKLYFQTMTINTEIDRELFGSELVQVTGKAKGSVVFINEYSKSAISLKNGTKIIGQNGKTYQTLSSVNIPGYTTDKNKKKVPGSSNTVNIVAIETGVSSNSNGINFTISGYTGSKKTGVYARSLSPLTGGDSGMKYTVSESEKDSVLENLKTQLSERLKRETRTQIPNGYITFPDLQFISIDTNSLLLSGEGIKFNTKIKGSMTSYLLPIKELEEAVGKEVLSDSQYSDIAIPNIASLSVYPESSIPANHQNIPETIKIKITGTGNIITKLKEELIISSLVGSKTKDFNKNISVFKEVETAKFKIFPFWSPIFPEKELGFEIKTY